MDIEELVITARLARLKVDEKELAASLPAFEEMLEFFAAMRAADNDENLARTAMKVDADYFRPDIVNENAAPGRELAQSLLDNPGQRDGRFVVIPNVL